MNWKRGVARLLIVLLPFGCLGMYLTLGEGQCWKAGVWVVATLSMFLLIGFGGYCVLCLVQLISYLFRWVFKGKSKAAIKKRSFKEDLRELALIISAVGGAALFLIFFAVETKGQDPGYLTAFIFSLISTIVFLGLVWGLYWLILFIARGFASDDTKAPADSKDKE